MSTAFQPPFVGSIDNGTSSTRFIIFDRSGKVVTISQKEYPQYYPHQGWAEQNLKELYSYTNDCIESAVKKFVALKLDVTDIKAIGITNQRETTCVWSRKTGEPLYNAIVWLDTRTMDLVKQLIQKTETKSKDHFQKVCGLPLSTYFSAVKLYWLLSNVEKVKEAALAGDLMFGTVDSWLLFKFTNGVHATDVTNASRTMLMNIETRTWDQQMLEFFEIPKDCLPEIKSSSEVYGIMTNGSLSGVPISGILGDQQAALVGQQCFKSGMLKNTYGTGCFMLCNTGTRPVYSTHGLLTTVGYQLGPSKPCYYALEGSIAIAGASVKWLRDNLKIITKASEVGKFAAMVEDNGGCYFVPAFSGLFAPHWRDDARGTLVGLTQYTNREHICRAVLEAVSFQTRDIMDSMERDSETEIHLLKVDGGMSMSNELMQIQADIAGVELVRPEMSESTAIGAAYAAGLAVNVWTSEHELPIDSNADTFKPNMDQQKRLEMRKFWAKAIEKSLNWA